MQEQMDRRKFLAGAAALGGGVLLAGCGGGVGSPSGSSAPVKKNHPPIGQEYMIPWDWGYASVLYRTDMVDPADATGWELFWNPKYKGRISMWDGAQSNFEVAGLYLGFPSMDHQTQDQVNQSRDALIKQKSLNKFYWKSEYSDMQPAFKSGDIWIAYSWQDAYVNMKAAGLKVEFMQPKQ